MNILPRIAVFAENLVHIRLSDTWWLKRPIDRQEENVRHGKTAEKKYQRAWDKNASTSAAVGKDGCAPNRVTDNAPTAQA